MPAGADTSGASERLTALICIGCGAVDVPRECVGTCLDHPFGLVRVGDMREAEAALQAADTAAAALEDLAVVLAAAEGTGADAVGALQARAREGLHGLGVAASSRGGRSGDDDVVTGWRCESCGRVEAPQPCIGVCTREPVEMVDATAFRSLSEALDDARGRAEAVAPLARRVAWTTPRAGHEERTVRAWQADARVLVAAESASRASPREAEPIGSRAHAE